MLGFERANTGSLDGQDISIIDGVDILLFLNSLDIFCQKHISYFELVIVNVIRINASLL